MLQDFDLHKGLLVKASLVTDHLHSSHHFVLVVTALEDLSEAAFPQYSQDFIPVCQLIVVHYIVVSSFIIIA